MTGIGTAPRVEDPTPLKRAAAVAAVRAEVRSGMVVGLGTGSTAVFVLDELGRRVRDEGLEILGVPTSVRTSWLAAAHGIQLTDLSAKIDIDIDGADEVDQHRAMTKGAGGAMTREKCVAVAASRLVIVVDRSKLVRRLSWPVPVEVLPFAKPLVESTLRATFPGAEPQTRLAGESPFMTDNGNLILDLGFSGRRPAPAALAAILDSMTGVVEHGLFVGMKPVVYVGAPEGVQILC